MKKIILTLFLLTSASAFASLTLVPQDRVQDYVSAVLAAEAPAECKTYYMNPTWIATTPNIEVYIDDEHSQLIFRRYYGSKPGHGYETAIRISADFKKITDMMSGGFTSALTDKNNGDLKNPIMTKVETFKFHSYTECH